MRDRLSMLIAAVLLAVVTVTSINIPARTVARFTPGKELKRELERI